MKTLQITPELLVEDMSKTVHFYENILGFQPQIIFPETNPIFVKVGRENVSIMLYSRSEFEKDIPKLKTVLMGGSTLLYITVEKVEMFYQEIKDNVHVIQPMHKTDYGSMEFTIEDCNGYFICFSERHENT
jgi:uncharacterized glyoxalase superfamily protein PhnB